MDKVDQYMQYLFQHGVEGYNALDKNTPSKGVVNPGGAKIFYHPTFRSNESRIQINRPDFGKALAESPTILYTLNRVETDEQGNPLRIGGNNYQRVAHGLMLYVDVANASENDVRGVRDHIVASSKSADISGHVKLFKDVADPEGKIREALSKITYQNFAREEVAIATPDNCIILALPSGAPGSQQFWSFVNRRAQSRAGMTQANTVSGVESSDIPF